MSIRVFYIVTSITMLFRLYRVFRYIVVNIKSKIYVHNCALFSVLFCVEVMNICLSVYYVRIVCKLCEDYVKIVCILYSVLLRCCILCVEVMCCILLYCCSLCIYICLQVYIRILCILYLVLCAYVCEVFG